MHTPRTLKPVLAILLISVVFLGRTLDVSHVAPVRAHATPEADGTFVEDFIWEGNHGATIKGGTATTVWWNEDAWDVRTDTAYNSAITHGGNEHTDIHRSVPDLTSGEQDNLYAIGGDGSPGVGVMHLDFEAISSARLRNPMLISSTSPGVVEFRTSNFVTTGHWWEIAITPAGTNDIVAGGEITSVPTPGTGADGGFSGNLGPGSSQPEDSINYITIGDGDVPCITGWAFENGIKKSIGGVVQDVQGPKIDTDPSEIDLLFAWRLEYYPDKIIAFVDLDRDGVKELHDTFNVAVPWSQVYVHLLAVAYQADHHPQGECFQGQVREIPWKDVRIGPVKYERTAAHPKNAGTERIPQQTGWTGYDIRDTQRFGPSTDNPSQANEADYDQHASMAFCSGNWYNCQGAVESQTLTFDLPASDAQGIARAQLIYDIRENGSGTLEVNGVNVGAMPDKSTVPGLTQDTEWAERSIDLDPSLLQPGQNTIKVTMSGNVGFDRLHFELAYGEPTLDWLSVQGNQIVDETGNTVVLRGVNIENREWVWSSTQSIDFERQAIPVATGLPDSGWGANVVLLAVASGPINRNETAYLEALDELVALAKSDYAYTLLGYRYAEPNGEQPTMPDQAAEDAMAVLADRYKDEPAVLYGLQVEPHDVTWSDLKPRFTTMIDAIQANNTNALIAVPGTDWSRYIDHALTDPIIKDNLVYKTHAYDTWNTIENNYQLAEVAAQYPVLIAEFGPGAFMSLDDVKSLLNFAEVTSISWVGWLFHDVGCPCMLTDSTTFATTEYGDEIKARLQAAAKGEPLAYKVLVFHKTGSFVHTSTLFGVAAIEELGVDNGFLVDDTVDGADFTDDNLAQYAAVVFLNTHQEVLDDAQQGAFERYIQAGGGYAGIHIASGTEYDWAWYGDLVGARFNFHPAIQQATVLIEDASHPSTASLPLQWVLNDEWYNFAPAPNRDQVRVLATVDESTYTGGDQGADHPIAWCQEYDGGRSWYTAMGHMDSHYSDANFLSHVLGGIEYAAGAASADCLPLPDTTPPSQPSALTATAVSSAQIDLSWDAATDAESGILNYIVYRDGGSVGTPTATTFSDFGLAEEAFYTYEVSAVNGVGTEGASSSVIAQTLIDTVAPSIESVSSGAPTSVIVVFSEPVELASAENPTNYAVDNGITVSSASLGGDLETVTLTTLAHSEGVTYTLTVNNVLDRAGTPNTIAANSQSSYTLVPEMVISSLTVASGRVYEVVDQGLLEGALAFIDRVYSVTSVPGDVAGNSYIKTANDDKTLTDAVFLTFDVNQEVTLYLAHDDRIASKSTWMSSFVDSGLDVVIDAQTHSLWSKDFVAGKITLGANEGVTESSMYVVVVKPAFGSSVNVPPVAAFTASPTSGFAPLDVTFDSIGSSDSDGSIMSYDWSFGDGSTALSAVVSHQFVADGSYTVTLTVTDDDGSTGEATAVITVDVAYPTLPGMSSPVQDLDADGKAEDLNGNSEVDFADVVLLFVNMVWIDDNGFTSLFDYNCNAVATVDMNDVQQLFNMAVGSWVPCES